MNVLDRRLWSVLRWQLAARGIGNEGVWWRVRRLSGGLDASDWRLAKLVGGIRGLPGRGLALIERRRRRQDRLWVVLWLEIYDLVIRYMTGF